MGSKKIYTLYREFLNDEISVSAVIGIILMVAIVTVVSSTVYVYVNDIPEMHPPIAVILDIEYNSVNGELVITHVGGDTIFDALYTGDTGETGTTEYEADIEYNVNGWTEITFDQSYIDPVVIAASQVGYTNSVENECTALIVVRNIDCDSCEVKCINDEGDDQLTDVGYVIMEKGHHIINDVEVEAGTYDLSSKSSSGSTVFTEAFETNSVTLAVTIQEDPGEYSIAPRYDEGTIRSTGFNHYSHEQYDRNSGWPGGTMTFGYIAMEIGDHHGFEGNIDGDHNVDFPNTWSTISFDGSYSNIPVILYGIIDHNGGDPCVTGMKDISTTGVKLTPAEGDNQDSEHKHAVSDMPWIVFNRTISTISGDIEGWGNLVVKINGRVLTEDGNNEKWDIEQYPDSNHFGPGDSYTINFVGSLPEYGDVISVVYTPQNQLIKTMEIK
jgi:hypothetical protein